jgi:hypothetical protein
MKELFLYTTMSKNDNGNRGEYALFTFALPTELQPPFREVDGIRTRDLRS